MHVDGSGVRRVSNGMGRTTCGYFYDGGRRILYSSTFEDSPDVPAAARPLAGLRLAARPLRDLHRESRRLATSGRLTTERRLRRRGHRVARREAGGLHQHPRRRHRALHDERGRERRAAADPPAGLRRRRLLLARRQADRLAGDVPRDRRRTRADYLRPAGAAAGAPVPARALGGTTPTAATPGR